MCSFYDPDVGDRGLRRMQRKSRPTFDFVKQGVFQRQAERQRLTVSSSSFSLCLLLPLFLLGHMTPYKGRDDAKVAGSLMG